MHNVSKPPKTVCMMQTELTKRAVAQIGEAIPHELGAKMINDFQLKHPDDVKCYSIGRQIIEQILSQPSCVGIKFYNAIAEDGGKTMVYVGLDGQGNPVVNYTIVTSDGAFESRKAIVADRIDRGTTTGTSQAEWWEEILID